MLAKSSKINTLSCLKTQAEGGSLTEEHAAGGNYTKIAFVLRDNENTQPEGMTFISKVTHLGYAYSSFFFF